MMPSDRKNKVAEAGDTENLESRRWQYGSRKENLSEEKFT